MTEDFFQKVALDLPNFSLQVIRQWFEHGMGDGWPPRLDRFGELTGRWRNVLAQRGLEFWRGVEWSLERGPWATRMLAAESYLAVESMRIAYESGLDHAELIPIPGSSARIGTFVRIIEATGRMPVPPILLLVKDGLEVLDGYHRLAAFVHVQENGGSVEPEQEVWVARASNAQPV
jgi:hypothetical protein